MNIFEILFSLLRNEITSFQFNEKTKALIDIETSIILYKLSKKHDLAHLVGAALDKNNLLPEGAEIQELFLQERSMAVYRIEQLSYELEQICRIFEDNALLHIPLKGSVIRQYYPEPWMRTSCDIDVLVKKEDLQRAVQLLKDNGFKYKETQSHDVHFWAESGVHIELHFDLIEESVAEKSAETLSGAWERATPCEGWKYRLEFDNEFFYLYHIAHMAKHFLQGGCGIRPFLDIWILNKKISLNIQKKEELLKQAELYTFAKNAEKLANIWFGNDEHNDTTKQMEDFILQGGVYGTLKQQLAMSQNKKGGKFKHLLSRIFLSYRAMLIYYPSLRKCPILYPFYQVRRWFRIAFCGGRKRALNEIKLNRNLSQLQKEKAKRLIDELGL